MQLKADFVVDPHLAEVVGAPSDESSSRELRDCEMVAAFDFLDCFVLGMLYEFEVVGEAR